MLLRPSYSDPTASSAYQSDFIRQALSPSARPDANGASSSAAVSHRAIRLDGRDLRETRQLRLLLTRDEACSEAAASLGYTKAVCVVRAQLAAPFPDRPTEGVLQISAAASPAAEAAGVSSSQIVRCLERAVRDSEALDLESLCVLAGERVWKVSCDVLLADFDGNGLDACCLAAIAALRAFRRPEVSVHTLLPEDTLASTVATSAAVAGHTGAAAVAGVQTVVRVHAASEREPLPLALHHTPLNVTLAVFKPRNNSSSGGGSADAAGGAVLVPDPLRQEETAQDGSITYTYNAHGELCGINRFGESCGMSAACVVEAAGLAAEVAKQWHVELASALASLETLVEEERQTRVELLRRRRANRGASAAATAADGSAVVGVADDGGDGIRPDDPILNYAQTHQAVFVTRDK